MARQLRPLAPGLLYHVIARGNQRRKVFLGEEDFNAYRERLARYRRRYGVVVHAYCLMPNHVHLLVETGSAPLSRFMQGVQQSYTQFFNRAHRKVGHAFQGRYKAIVCERDRYLTALVRYIHLNPVRAGLVKVPSAYRHSGHGAYLAGRGDEVVDPRPVLGVLGGTSAYRRFVADGMGQRHEPDYYQVDEQSFLGSEGFGQKVKTVLGAAWSSPRPRRPSGEGFRRLARAVGMPEEALRGPDRRWAVSEKRSLVAYVLIRRMGYAVKEVSAWLHRDQATISSMLYRFEAGLSEGKMEHREIEKLEKA